MKIPKGNNKIENKQVIKVFLFYQMKNNLKQAKISKLTIILKHVLVHN